MTELRTDTRKLGYELLVLSRKIDNAVDSANAHEAAERLVEQTRDIALLKEEIERLKAQGDAK